MILERISIDCDLSETSYEEACKKTFASVENPPSLYVSTNQIRIGRELYRKFYKNAVLRVDDHLDSDEWYVKTRYHGIFSPGV